MRKASLFLITIMFLFGLTAIGGEESSRFYKVIADYFETDFETVFAFSETGIADDDLAVVFFVSQETGTATKKLAEFRLRKESWTAINKVRGADASDFYILIMAEIKSKIYAPIFQKYKDTAEEDWGKISLSDEEIINLVNLKMISKYHGYSVFEVMAMRDMGKGFARINNDIADLKLELLKKQKEEQKRKKEQEKKMDEQAAPSEG